MQKVLEEIRKELDHWRLNKQYQQQRCPSDLKKRIIALKKEVGVRELVKQLNLHYDFFSQQTSQSKKEKPETKINKNISPFIKLSTKAIVDKPSFIIKLKNGSEIEIY